MSLGKLGGTGGRQRKPRELHELEGTLNTTRSGKEDPRPHFESGEIEPPKELSDNARDFWDTVVVPMNRVNAIKPCDLHLAVEMCEAYDAYKQAREYRATVSPADAKDFSLASGNVNKTWTVLSALVSTFHCTPSLREKLVRADDKHFKDGAESLFDD